VRYNESPSIDLVECDFWKVLVHQKLLTSFSDYLLWVDCLGQCFACINNEALLTDQQTILSSL